jgi:predicted nucleotidyltransferase
MRLTEPLDDLLSSKAKVAILRAICHANAPLSGREIARRAGVWSSAASKALGQLAASGILSCRDHGRAKTYELDNTDVPLVAKLRELFRAEADRYRGFVADVVRDVAEALTVVLFGSEARSEARPGSDTDVLIVIEQKDETLEERVLDRCLDIAMRHGIALSWHVADLHDLREWEATGDPFWRNVTQDGVRLHGSTLEALKRRWQHGKAS